MPERFFGSPNLFFEISEFRKNYIKKNNSANISECQWESADVKHTHMGKTDALGFWSKKTASIQYRSGF